MGYIKLKFPVLVQNIEFEEKPHYHLRPLFLNHPVTSHQRFKLALNKLQKEIKHIFSGFTVSNYNVNYMEWFLFNPNCRYEQYPVDFTFAREHVKGNIGVVSFELKGMTCVLLPNLKQYVFIARADNEGKIDLGPQIEKAALRVFKEAKSIDGDVFDAENYLSNKKEFITELLVDVKINHSDFKFNANDDFWFFARLFGDTSFDGYEEVEKVGYSLHDLYPGELRRAYYMDDLVDKVYQIVYQKNNTALAIVGPEGVGRHTLIHETVYRYITDYYSKKGVNEFVWHVDPTRVISGMSIVGMWQKRFEAIIEYLKNPSNNPKYSDKLMIDNPVALLRIGRSAQNHMTLSDVLKPYLEKRELQLILIASPEEWKVMQEKDRRFSDLFQVIRLKEPSMPLSAKIILRQRRVLESENDTKIRIQAINQLFTIQRNYLKNSALPGSIMKMLQRLAVKHQFDIVDAPEVREEFKAFSGLEERIFDSSQKLSGDEILRRINRELVGQHEAARALTDVIQIIKSKLADKTRPISSFMFVGPTGVGKTQAAKVLCKFLMGSSNQLIRFDMNEFIDAYASQRLIGDYYNPEGLLTGKVRYQPFGILLLDEIEKAHPDVHDLLLQVLDDGRLTDSLGRTVDFTNTIIIMTSNLGASEVSNTLGYSQTQQNISLIYRRAVEKFFRPEFINRVDKIVIFKPLQIEHILGIAQLQIKELLQRDGFVRRTTILNISPKALEWVARRGFDARMGGRALKRQIERDLTALSAEQLIKTPSDRPIIMDINLVDDQLQPKITTLDFVDPVEEEIIPSLPEAKKGKIFYNQLLRELEQLEHDLLQGEAESDNDAAPVMVFSGDHQNKEDLNWQYFQFKARLNEMKENIRTIMLGFRDRYFKDAPAIPLRLKRGYLVSRKDPGTKGWRENFKDRLFQEEALKEISEGYNFASSLFDSFKTEFIDNYLDVKIVKLFAKGVMEERPNKSIIAFRSCITGLGNEEVDFLIEKYTTLLQKIEVNFTINRKQKFVLTEGYSVFELLQGEAGIHLFYIAHQNPLPIEVKVYEGNQLHTPYFIKKVIRIYDGNSTLTDLRTGYSNAVNITPSELKILLFAGIKSEIRATLFD